MRDATKSPWDKDAWPDGWNYFEQRGTTFWRVGLINRAEDSYSMTDVIAGDLAAALELIHPDHPLFAPIPLEVVLG